jgi:hypothetical protein
MRQVFACFHLKRRRLRVGNAILLSQLGGGTCRSASVISVSPNVLDSISNLGISGLRVSPLIDHRPCRRYKRTFDIDGCMLTAPFKRGIHSIELSRYGVPGLRDSLSIVAAATT